jgi:hypothetical protein
MRPSCGNELEARDRKNDAELWWWVVGDGWSVRSAFDRPPSTVYHHPASLPLFFQNI